MNEAKQFNYSTVKVLWYTMQASVFMLIVLIYILNSFVQLDPVLPHLSNIFIGLCVVSIAAPFIFLGYFKRIQNKIRDNIQLGMDNTPSELHRYITFLLIGMSLCDLTGMFGFALYIIVGNLKFALFFIAVSFCLGFLYKPELK
jgi:hypothetical protein